MSRRFLSTGSAPKWLAILALCACVAGCGIKPKLSELEAPDKDQKVALQNTGTAETIDGVVDGQEPISKKKPKRGFILDPLL